ncbi:related to FMP30-mitochondrial inner membrane protein with a role in maintaining mitochondrial morphology [Sporisorium reilianum f. sp. reilianum]|uniref:Related to FMP30-mitochondrial inner membrane protein with a role in maintaining mitochondrial morphology n=1 Tax=Sporisorium reilianum f. sp. reilianum TaxID=72559 RepID=A0A2N8ULJ8_9BASI|nr:related to FMP30-mitochondrial inner membrane protein with a role in maintaining mitochondrial morphology [Sporisorium reilianum f. sp. reilianum]
MLPTKPQQIKTALVSISSLYIAGWGIYYLAQETIRRRELASRKRKYPLRAPLLPPHAISSGVRVAERVGVLAHTNTKSASGKETAADTREAHEILKQRGLEDDASNKEADAVSPPETPTRSPSWYGGATETEVTRIHKRFSSLKVLGRYANVVPEWREQGAWEWVAWKLFYSVFYKPRIWWDGGLKADEKTQEGRQKIEMLLPVERIQWDKLFAPSTASMGSATPVVRASDQSSFTWIGQSTCLIQLNGVTILTDPVFGQQPVTTLFSPTRMRPMPCSIHELVANAAIDVVLLTHNHFDHLDIDVLPLIPKHTTFIVPVGLTPLLEQYGVEAERIVELDWWQQKKLPLSIRVASKDKGTSADATGRRRCFDITAVPASHWSARTPLDTNTTLWNSYAVRVYADDHASAASRARSPTPASEAPSLFFCGDTGYSPSLFTAIGRALGPFDVACLPIGSYEPRWHMQIQHMHVTESVQVTRDIGSRRAFAMHWGTWSMSDETWDDPYWQLHKEIQNTSDVPERLLAVPFGKTFWL